MICNKYYTFIHNTFITMPYFDIDTFNKEKIIPAI